jgi:hypothetical protein
MPDIEIDTSRLTFPVVEILEAGTGFIDGSTAPPPTVAVPARGGYHLRHGDGLIGDFQFEVRADGTVDFDAAFDGFLAGRGGRRLTVLGYRVNIDGRLLSLDLPPLDVPGEGTWLPRATANTLTLMPASGYGFRPTAGLVPCFRFGLAIDGRLTAGPPAQAVLQHRRVLAQSLHVLTRWLLLAGGTGEARAAAEEAFEAYRQWAAAPDAEVATVASAILSFSAELNSADLHAEPVAGAQTAAQILHQYPPPPAALPQHRRVLAQAVHLLTRWLIFAGRIAEAHLAALDAIDAYRQWAATPDVDPATAASGLLSFSSELNSANLHAESVAAARAAAQILRQFPPPDFTQLADVSGDTLTIRGCRITIDGHTLAHDLLPLGFPGEVRWLSRATPNQLVLIPGQQYGFQAGNAAVGTWRFGVALDGTVILDPSLASFASAEGSTLTIRGHDITIIATALPFDLLPLPPAEPRLPRTQANHLTLMPARPYLFQGGSVAVSSWGYEVGLDGNVILDPALHPFATAHGSTLTISGYRITIDGHTLSHDLLLLPIGPPALSRHQPNEVVLMPSPGYLFQAGNAAVGTWRFGVALDGTVILDPSLASFASAEGSTLTIRGHDITVNGTALSADLVPLPPGEPHLPRTQANHLTLMPARTYLFQMGNVVADMSYDVTIDGSIDFPQSCDGFLAGRGTKTLVVQGCPVAIDATQADSDLVGITNLGVQPHPPRQIFAVLLPGTGYLPRTTNGVFATPFTIGKDGRVVAGAAGPGTTGFYVAKISTSPNPSGVGEEVTVEVAVRTVHSGHETPQGRVTLTEGAAVLDSSPLDPNGTASLRTTALGPGDHDILVDYHGNQHFQPSSTRLRHQVR